MLGTLPEDALNKSSWKTLPELLWKWVIEGSSSQFIPLDFKEKSLSMWKATKLIG